MLRGLVARQRARGERAFYHFVDDQRLLALCRGDLRMAPVHARRSAEEERSTLRAGLEDVLSELDDLDASRRLRRREEDSSGAAEAQDGRRALEEAAARDASRCTAVTSAGSRSQRRARRPHGRRQEESGDLDAIRIVLATIAEVVGELAGDSLHRRPTPSS